MNRLLASVFATMFNGRMPAGTAPRRQKWRGSRTMTLGLREQIARATSRAAVDRLAASGAGYLNASQGTRSSWARTAARVKSRLHE